MKIFFFNLRNFKPLLCFFVSILLLIFLLFLLNNSMIVSQGLPPLTDSQKKEKALETLSQWQDFLNSDEEINSFELEWLFDSYIDVNNPHYEKKMRTFYKVKENFPISMLGILMRLKKEELLFKCYNNNSILKGDFNENILKEFDNEKFKDCSALIVKKIFNKENDALDIVALLILYYGQSIDIEFSKIKGRTIVDILSLAPDGSILDKDLEKAFLKKVKSYNLDIEIMTKLIKRSYGESDVEKTSWDIIERDDFFLVKIEKSKKIRIKGMEYELKIPKKALIK